MLPYRNLTEAELALGRNLTYAENLWFRYSASMPDYLLYYHNFAILLLVFTLAPLPIAVTEIFRPSIIAPFKLQPKISLPPSSFLRCYKDGITVFLLLVAPLQLISYPSAKLVGIRASLPLPSASEIAAQLVVYFLVEDYVHYWIHRALHSKWGYEKIHRVHHEFIAPIGFAAPHAHWAEVLLLGIPAFLGPALAPGHMITFWLWFALRHCEAIDTHTGCYKDVLTVFLVVVVPLQLISYPSVKLVGIRTSLPLPSAWEIVAQLVVYFLVEDYGNYWIHRAMHSKWGYEKIHHVHHEFIAPIGFAAPYAHWAEVLVLGIPSFLGPALAPGHMITFWLWIALRQCEAIDTHIGYDFPFSPTKFIPFYGGAEHHDYHHYVGGLSQSNFASVFTYCDYIYGTDKGYRFQKAHLQKLREQWAATQQKGIETANHEGKFE